MVGGIGMVAAIGGLLIVAALVFAVYSNKRRSRGDRRRTQDATANLYREIDREDQVSDPDPKNF